MFLCSVELQVRLQESTGAVGLRSPGIIDTGQRHHQLHIYGLKQHDRYIFATSVSVSTFCIFFRCISTFILQMCFGTAGESTALVASTEAGRLLVTRNNLRNLQIPSDGVA